MPTEDWPPFLPPEALLRLEGDLRREAGRQHFTAVMGLLLEPISHPLLSELADWACNEPGTLHTSQISLLRNGKTRMLGTKCVDALGRINQAVWVVQQRPELLPRLGTGPLSDRLAAVVARVRPLLHPSSGAPLAAGDFLALYLGTLRLPLPASAALAPEQAQRLAVQLGPWLDQALRERGLSVREAGQRLRAAWTKQDGGADPAGVERLLRVMAGFEDCDPAWLAVSWEPVQLSLAAVLGQELPADLGS